MHKIGQLTEFLHRLLVPLLNTGLPLIKNVLKTLNSVSNVFIRLKIAASATNVAIHKSMFGPGMTALIISNEEIPDIMKIGKNLVY